ncbi:MAG: hypothetical protein K9J13_16195 [Saprospiraceae bacterium]|nr:hypothetical protein [Saprospiraceae bacterium]
MLAKILLYQQELETIKKIWSQMPKESWEHKMPQSHSKKKEQLEQYLFGKKFQITLENVAKRQKRVCADCGKFFINGETVYCIYDSSVSIYLPESFCYWDMICDKCNSTKKRHEFQNMEISDKIYKVKISYEYTFNKTAFDDVVSLRKSFEDIVEEFKFCDNKSKRDLIALENKYGEAGTAIFSILLGSGLLKLELEAGPGITKNIVVSNEGVGFMHRCRYLTSFIGGLKICYDFIDIFLKVMDEEGLLAYEVHKNRKWQDYIKKQWSWLSLDDMLAIAKYNETSSKIVKCSIKPKLEKLSMKKIATKKDWKMDKPLNKQQKEIRRLICYYQNKQYKNDKLDDEIIKENSRMVHMLIAAGLLQAPYSPEFRNKIRNIYITTQFKRFVATNLEKIDEFITRFHKIRKTYKIKASEVWQQDEWLSYLRTQWMFLGTGLIQTTAKLNNSKPNIKIIKAKKLSPIIPEDPKQKASSIMEIAFGHPMPQTAVPINNSFNIMKMILDKFEALEAKISKLEKLLEKNMS